MLIHYLLMLSSLLTIIGAAMLAYGYRASLASHDPATRWFVWGMVLICASIFGRRGTWDLLHPIVVAGQVDQRPLNIVFNLICVAGLYSGLQSRLMLIPEDERPGWHWWSAWLHPSPLRFRPGRPED